MSIQKLACACLLAVLTLVSTSASAAEAKVIITGDCDYVLLDSPAGQILAKLIKGEKPKTGDVLEGSLEKGFSDLVNRRTGDTLQTWIDMIDSGATKVLMRFGQYCN